MANNMQALKARIRSVKSTKKITGAMELIATGKLKKQKKLMESNRLYAETLHKTMHKILGSVQINEIRYLQAQTEKKATLIFTSDLGLCGGYNSNMIHFLKENASLDEPLIVVGSKENQWLKHSGYTIAAQLDHSDGLTFQELAKLGDGIMRMFDEHKIGGLRVIYTKFINSMTFEPISIDLLPIIYQPQEIEHSIQDTIFEPNAITLINQLIPMYMHSLLYGLWLETKTSEQASRRMAMDNATDNAEELIDELLLQYNQSRQAAITQEITEIVAGAEAL